MLLLRVLPFLTIVYSHTYGTMSESEEPDEEAFPNDAIKDDVKDHASSKHPTLGACESKESGGTIDYARDRILGKVGQRLGIKDHCVCPISSLRIKDFIVGFDDPTNQHDIGKTIACVQNENCPDGYLRFDTSQFIVETSFGLKDKTRAKKATGICMKCQDGLVPYQTENDLYGPTKCGCPIGSFALLDESHAFVSCYPHESTKCPSGFENWSRGKRLMCRPCPSGQGLYVSGNCAKCRVSYDSIATSEMTVGSLRLRGHSCISSARV